MSQPNRMSMTHLGGFLAALLVSGCARPTAPPPAAEKPKDESKLGFITMSGTAAEKLGIKTEPAVNKPVQEHVPLTGWVMVRQGNEGTLTAPVAGYVREPSGGRWPIVGEAVGAGKEVLAV